jgi:hypothetical protein
MKAGRISDHTRSVKDDHKHKIVAEHPPRVLSSRRGKSTNLALIVIEDCFVHMTIYY